MIEILVFRVGAIVRDTGEIAGLVRAMAGLEPIEAGAQVLRNAETKPLLGGRLRDEVELLYEHRRTRYEEADRRIDADRSPDDVAADVLAQWSG